MPLLGTRRYPKGPKMKYFELHKMDVSGTHIEFAAPRHNHNTISPLPDIEENNINLYDTEQFSRYNNKNKDEPATFGLCLKYWRYFGIPLLDGTGVLGDVTFNPSISYMPEFTSLFHPRHLECAIERYIYKAPDTYRLTGFCRENWKSVKLNGITWVNYRSQGSAGFRNAEEVYESVWHTPITDQHLLTVRFDQVIRFKRTRLAEV